MTLFPARTRHRSNGFSLLEVLVTLLIFSLGLIGLAGLLLLSVKTNYASIQRTQAIFLAQSLSERMRSNVIGVWNGSYDGKWSAVPSASCDPTSATGCSPVELASWDLAVWFDAVQQSLAHPRAEVACAKDVIVAPPDLNVEPPFQSTCAIRLSWKETLPQGTVDDAGNTATGNQTFSWIFTP
jgi:type IV pilus assembly protein PilV